MIPVKASVKEEQSQSIRGQVSERADGNRLGAFIEVLSEFLQRRARSAIAVAIGVVVLAVGFRQLWPTEANQLERRADQYMKLFDGLNFEASYEFLTPELRGKISREAYVRQYSIERGMPSKVSSIKVTEPSKRGYVVVVSTSPTGDELRTRIGWVMDGGQWYRDLALDRADLVKQMSGSRDRATALCAMQAKHSTN